MSNSPLQSHGSISQRGLLSISMLLFSVGGLTIAMLAGAKLVFDIFSVGLVNSLDTLGIKVIVVGLAYIVGWVTSMLAIRVYGKSCVAIHHQYFHLGNSDWYLQFVFADPATVVQSGI